jgi:hypothetical protein
MQDKCCDISQRHRLVKGSSAASVAGTIAGEEVKGVGDHAACT